MNTNYTTNVRVCKASKHGMVRGSQYYAFATLMPDGTVVESAEVVSTKLDRKPKGIKALCKADAKRRVARAEMESLGWL